MTDEKQIDDWEGELYVMSDPLELIASVITKTLQQNTSKLLVKNKILKKICSPQLNRDQTINDLCQIKDPANTIMIEFFGCLLTKSDFSEKDPDIYKLLLIKAFNKLDINKIKRCFVNLKWNKWIPATKSIEKDLDLGTELLLKDGNLFGWVELYRHFKNYGLRNYIIDPYDDPNASYDDWIKYLGNYIAIVEDGEW